MLDLRQQARRMAGRNAPFRIEPALEPIYRDLFLRELAQIEEKDFFFPTGGAANYGLLYLILRIGVELKPRSVLDVGAGQSTLLWSMLHRRGIVAGVVTLESDDAWAARIAAQVQHPMIVSPLRTRIVDGHRLETYDWSAVRADGPFEVIVCDGPRGQSRHSRAGVLELIDDSLPADFILIFDDAERPGEQDTIAAAHTRLQALGRTYEVGIVRAAKSQAVFASGRFIPATFM